MVEEPDQTPFIPRHPHYPWEALTGDSPWSTEQIVNLRQHEDDLETNGSEFGFGRGTEPPWITHRAAQQHRYATPAEGGRYHGKSPPLPRQEMTMQTNNLGSRNLVRFLHQNG